MPAYRTTSSIDLAPARDGAASVIASRSAACANDERPSPARDACTVHPRSCRAGVTFARSSATVGTPAASSRTRTVASPSIRSVVSASVMAKR